MHVLAIGTKFFHFLFVCVYFCIIVVFSFCTSSTILLYITSQNKIPNNFETVRYMRNKSMNHDFETGVSLLDSINKTCVKRRLAEKSR